MTQPRHPKTLPGPWKLIRGESASYEHEFIVETADGTYVAAWSMPRSERKNTQARGKYIHAARLMAAAPELLEALKQIEDTRIGHWSDGEMRAIARAAIAKATGQKDTA